MTSGIKNSQLSWTIVVAIIIFMAVYVYFFSKAIIYSPDGASYVTIFSRNNMFEGREEVGFLVFAWLLKNVFNNGYLSMYICVLLSYVLYLQSAKLYIGKSFSMVHLSLLLFLSVTRFSNSLGVQIRIGLASFLLAYILIYFTSNKSSIKNKNIKKILQFILLIIPILFHYGTAIASMCALCLTFTSQKAKKWGCIIFIISIPLVQNLLMNYFMSSDAYYSNYLNGQLSVGRSLPFSLVLYALCLLIILAVKKNKSLNTMELFSLSGIGLIVTFFQGIYLSAKMLEPFGIMALICCMRYINLIHIKDSWVLGFMMYLLSFLGFYYYSDQIGLTSL